MMGKFTEGCGKFGEYKAGKWRKTEIFRKGTLGWTVEEQKECSISGSEDQFSDTDKADLENIRVAKEMGVTGVMQPFVRGREDLNV